MKKILAMIYVAGVALSVASASNLANPAVAIPLARIAVGASYDLDGITITNDKVPCLMNRFEARLSYSPWSFMNLGIDGGTMEMDVASDTTATDTFQVFHGKYGISAGGHLKLSTPFYFNETVCAVGILHGSYFSSENEAGASYSGTDANGGLGLQFHLKNFGYITAGSTVYLIFGKDRSYDGSESKYSNINNVRGWVAIDYFPTPAMNSKNIIYISLEASIGPKVAFNERAPIQEMSVSVSIGSISRRLYGQTSEVEWTP